MKCIASSKRRLRYLNLNKTERNRHPMKNEHDAWRGRKGGMIAIEPTKRHVSD